jgi:hypothetical protein
VAAGEEASTRAAQLEELEADLGALLVALAQDKAAFDMDPLWLPRPVARSIGAAMKESTQQLTATLLRLNLATKALARTP